MANVTLNANAVFRILLGVGALLILFLVFLMTRSMIASPDAAVSKTDQKLLGSVNPNSHKDHANPPIPGIGSGSGASSSSSSSKSSSQQQQHLDTAYRRIMAHPHVAFVYSLSERERSVYSQDGTDGILEYIFDNIGTTTKKFYVEFGTQNCTECNTKLLWERYGWNGLLIDGDGKTNDARVIRNHFITAENIVSLFKKYDVPEVFDFLSVDIDRNDYYVARKIMEANYRPRVIEIEVNNNFNSPTASYAIKYDSNKWWDGTYRSGLTPLAAARLFNKYGYHAVAHSKGTWNLFFIHRSAIASLLHKATGLQYSEEDVKVLLPPFAYIYRRVTLYNEKSFKEVVDTFDQEEWNVIEEDGSYKGDQA